MCCIAQSPQIDKEYLRIARNLTSVVAHPYYEQLTVGIVDLPPGLNGHHPTFRKCVH